MQKQQKYVGSSSTPTPTHYTLRCPACGQIFNDNGYILECPVPHEAALLEAVYTTKKFQPEKENPGLFRYKQWLPIRHTFSHGGQVVTYKSQHLSRMSELTHLWIAFNGYWPERDIRLETATFKELEAYAVLARLPLDEQQCDVLVVSSAGNTAAAFATACSQLQHPCLIVMPESGLQGMQFSTCLDPCVTIISLLEADYADAIAFANTLAKQEGFVAEGGVKNIGRRAGLGTVLLNAVEAIGRLPDYYFQAIGSGSGAIAVHESAQRLIEDGRYGTTYPHLMLSQNVPFTPIYDSWQHRQRTFVALNPAESKQRIQRIAAQVLSNRQPPYSLIGGVFDVLTASQGDMLIADNQEVVQAQHLFRDLEGIDIHPAAGVAVATLLKAARNGQIEKDATILLNITGGGWEQKKQHQPLIAAQPALRINASEISTKGALEGALSLYK